MRGSAIEVLWVALKLGLTSFGGPIAHFGAFERTYIRQRGWLSGEQYGGLISLCQLLPGPTSSQVGVLVGLHRAGWLGAIAAWIGFTLPSAVVMVACARFLPNASSPSMQAIQHGLMLTAIVVVAQAVLSMSRSLAPDWPRRTLAVAACMTLLVFRSSSAQLLTLLGGAIAGVLLFRSMPHVTPKVPPAPPRRVAWILLSTFLIVLVGLSSSGLFRAHGVVALAGIFYRTGALVFGGGHVVLPLLQQALVPTGWISADRFLAGYGLAQALPGPLFTLAGYLGAASAPPNQSILWALVSLIALFLPGLLLAVAGLSLLGHVADNKITQAMLAGVNATVVGLLAAALYNPVWVSSVRSLTDAAIALLGFIFATRFKLSSLTITACCVGASVIVQCLVGGSGQV